MRLSALPPQAVAAFGAEGLDGDVTALGLVWQTRVPHVAKLMSLALEVTGARCPVSFHGHAGMS